MIRRLLILLPLLAVLGACAAPQERLARTADDPSQPNVVSIYYYLCASYLHYSGDFRSADDLYSRALVEDEASPQIKKQMLINNAYAYINGQQSGDITLPLFASARATQTLDQDLLNAAYSVYSQAGDKASMDWVINESIARYPSCRAYLQKFYLDYDATGSKDTKPLEKAYKLAGKNVDDLVLCARMYALVNPKRAIAILDEAIGINPTPQANQLLNDLYIRNTSTSEAAAFYRAYTYPKDKALMLEFLQTASKTMNFPLIMEVQNEILTIQDAAMLAELAFAAYMKDDENLLVKTWHALTQKTPEPEEDAGTAIFLLAQSLSSDAMDSPQVYADKLFGSRDVDDMLLYRTLRYTMQPKTPGTDSNTKFNDDLREAVDKRLPDSPLTRYIKVYQQELLNPADSLKASRTELSEYFAHKNRGYEEDWTTVIADYQVRGKYQEKIALLRKAIVRFPRDPLFLNDLGYTLLEYPDSLDEAGALISQAIAIEPGNAYYQDSMAWYYWLKNDLVNAREHIQIPMQLKEIPGEIAYHIGIILFASNERDIATGFLKTAAADVNFPIYQEKAKAALIRLGTQP